MTDGAWRKEATAAEGDRLALVIPPVLWRLGGKSLDGMHALAWAWLRQRARAKLPDVVECRAVDLADYFGRKSHVSALDWIKALVAQGLVEWCDSQQGNGGGLRLRLLDPYEVAELRVAKADPQMELPLEIEPDVVSFRAAWNNAEATKCQVGDGQPDIQTASDEPKRRVSDHQPDVSTPHVAAAGPDLQPALFSLLASQLGAERAELWLGNARIESQPDGVKLFYATQLLADHYRQFKGRQIQQAYADAGLAGSVEYLADPNPPTEFKRRVSDHQPDVTAQEPRLVNRSSSSASINQPTNQGILENVPDEKETLVRAKELYQRINDPTLWRWMPIAAVLLVDQQRLSPAELAELVLEHPCDFGQALKALAIERRCWPNQGQLKTLLRARGIKWKREWERGTQPKEPAR